MQNFQIKSRWDSSKIVYQAKAESFAALVQAAIRASANLYGANLSGANLYGADLRSADLRSADLRSADLSGANLYGADLRSADLRSAKNIPALTSAQTSIVPEHGAFVGWKICQGSALVQVQIPAKAKRSNATGRKCRAEYVKVLQVIGAKEGISQHNSSVKYVKGKTVKCDIWNEDRWTECGGGIHFFLTRVEAENY